VRKKNENENEIENDKKILCGNKVPPETHKGID